MSPGRMGEQAVIAADQPRMHARAVREANDQRKCGAEMKAIAVIENPAELRNILRHPGRMAEQVP